VAAPETPEHSTFMQAVGMVNDHTTACFRYRELT
jgi:3-methyladenine DNA glycosylase Tag